jgi:hypothetical protein
MNVVWNTPKMKQCSEEFEDNLVKMKHFSEGNAVCAEALLAIPEGANHRASSPRSSLGFVFLAFFPASPPSSVKGKKSK